MIAVAIAFTRRGAVIGEKIAAHLNAPLYLPERIALEAGCEGFPSLAEWTRSVWESSDAIVFVGACGIAVRAIAPFVKDKFTDPAVISIDESGHFVIPLLSGHVGGANALALDIANLIGAQAAISTATDLNGLFAVDVWAKQNGLVISDRAAAKRVSAAILEGECVQFISDYPIAGTLPAGVKAKDGELKVYITTKTLPDDALRLIPKAVILGIGCRRGVGFESIEEAVLSTLSEHNLDLRSVCRVCSIDLKKGEPGLLEFCRVHELEFITYTAEELMTAPGEFVRSEFVQSVTGADNVCQRAAALGGGQIIINKTAKSAVTVAAAIADVQLEF